MMVYWSFCLKPIQPQFEPCFETRCATFLVTWVFLHVSLLNSLRSTCFTCVMGLAMKSGWPTACVS